MDIEGLSDLLNTLSNSNEQFEDEAAKLITKVGNKVLRVTKMNTPVSSKDGEPGGTLRRAWRFRRISSFEGVVKNSMDYSAHVEFGHRTRQGMGNSKPPNYKYKPKPGGIKFVPGVYMLKRGVESAESSMGQELEAFIENLWREE